LYIACIILIADYGVPIWWNNQKYLLEKFQRLQNAVLRTILGAFKISLIKVMEIEAAVPPSRIRFEKTCYNYIIRIIQMNSMYLIIERVPEDFPPFIGKAEFNSAKFLKWNNLIHPETDNENEKIQISDSESDFSNDEIHRRKKRKKRKKKKKVFPSQLIRLIARLRRINPELAKLKKVDFS